jgi:multicomponent Na+:H+ antiporter subunit D
MALPDIATVLPPAIPVLLAAVLAAVTDRRIAHGVGFLALATVLGWVFVVPAGPTLATSFLGFDVVLFNVDATSRLMGFIFSLIGSAAVVYAAATGAGRTTIAFALAYVGTSLGAVFAGDWLTLVFFWELMALTSTLLVWEHGGPAVRAGFRYAVLHAIGGSLLMAAVLLHYVEVGSFLFAEASGIAPGLPAALAAVAIGVNVGFVGLHAWLPDTYPRPHVAASVFLCVYTTKTGVYAMVRAFPEGHLWIAYLGTGMAVYGVVFALLQDDMRRLLSYHIQSQVGYMVAGVGIPSALATAGALAHVFNHILYKGLLFMVVGVVIYRTGREKLSELGGLWRVMPLTAVIFAVAALSISGFPGFNGFVSKGMVTAAAHNEHLDTIYYLLLAAGVGTFLSFMKLGYYAFLKGEVSHRVPDANRGQQAAMGLVAALCILFGLFPDPLFAMLPGQGATEAHPFTTDHLLEGVVLAAIALVVFAVIKTPLKKIPRPPDVDALYNPTSLYGTRAVVVAVTETYAAVDRLAVGLATLSGRLASDPHPAVDGVLVAVGRRDGTEDDPPSLRAGLGTSVTLVVVVVTVVLLALLL